MSDEIHGEAEHYDEGFTEGADDERLRCAAIIDEAWKSPKLTPQTRMAMAVVARRIRDPAHVPEPGADSAADYLESIDAERAKHAAELRDAKAAHESSCYELDADIAALGSELAALKEANARLEAAVRGLGQCPDCSGTGRQLEPYRDSSGASFPYRGDRACPTCRGDGFKSEARAALAPPRAEPARLDPTGTATGKTILTAPVVSSSKTGIGTMYPGPASTHVDLETGKRTGLVHSQPTVPKVAIDHAPACDAPPERPRVGYRCRCGAVGYRIATPQPTGPRERTPVCPGPDCLACNGEACELCGAGMGNTDPSRPRCEHGTIERHTQPTGDGQVKP